MSPELREAVGKVLYEATVDLASEYVPEWQYYLRKEEWMQRAEKVVEAFNAAVNDKKKEGESV